MKITKEMLVKKEKELEKGITEVSRQIGLNRLDSLRLECKINKLIIKQMLLENKHEEFFG